MSDKIIKRMYEAVRDCWGCTVSCETLKYVLLGNEEKCGDTSEDCRKCEEEMCKVIRNLEKQFMLEPTYLDKNGEEIKVGDSLYGQDGALWTVIKFDDNNENYPVVAKNINLGERGLKCEWLSSKRPSLRSTVLYELRSKGVSQETINYITALMVKF